MGADEIFGGYMNYMRSYSAIQLHKMNELGMNRIEQILWQPELTDTLAFAGVPRFFNDEAKKQYFHPPFSNWDHTAQLASFYRECISMKSNAHLFELMVSHECQHRIPELLHAGYEPIGKQNKIQTLYPFLNSALTKKVIGLGANARFTIKDGAWDNKLLMRYIASLRLPKEIAARPRIAYIAPMLTWLKNKEFSTYIWTCIEESLLWQEPLLNKNQLQKLKPQVDDIVENQTEDNLSLAPINELWALLTLCAWYDRWVTGKK